MKLNRLSLLLISGLAYAQGLTQVNPFNAPSGPAGVIGVDLDKNNVKDFVFVSTSANTVNVFLTITASSGGGGGTGNPNPWAPFNVYPVGQAPVAVAAGDWNKDTNVDLLVANAGSQDVSVLTGNGLGGFTASSPIALGVTPTAIAVTDVDLDTNLDLVIGHAGGVLVIYGGPTPRPSLNLPLAAPVAAVAVSGANPLVAVTMTAGALTVFKTDGLGGLIASVSGLAVNGGLRTLLFEDVNRDGNSDVIVDRAADLGLLTGDGLGNFSAVTSIALPGGFVPFGISAVDVDGNLWPELVVSSTTGQIHVLRGSAPGFSAGFTATVASPTTSLAAGKYNAFNYFMVLQPAVSQATLALFQLPPAVNVTLQTSPAGLQGVVGGQTVVAPNTSSRATGSALTLDVPSPQSAGVGSRQNFLSWSQGGAKSQTVVVPSVDTTYVASFQTQYQVTTTVNPAGAGTVSLTPSSIDGFYNAGTSVIASASANACYVANGILPAANMTVSGPATLTANFLSSIATNASSQVQVTRTGQHFLIER